jgi:hypothetical protein
VFEATVKTCRDGCQPAYCTGQAGRSDPSFGRRKRSTNGTETLEDEKDLQVITSDEENKNGNFAQIFKYIFLDQFDGLAISF